MTAQLSLLDLISVSPPDAGLRELWTPDDIYTALDAEGIVRFREDYRVERKSARKSIKELADDLSAFANAQPHGGVIIVGVEDGGDLTGFAGLGDDRVSEFEGTNPHCPDARVETRRIGITNKKGNPDFILAIRVHYRHDRLVETTAGHAFIRLGREKRRLTEAEKREIRITRGEIDYEKEPVTLRYPDDFNTSLIADFCASFVEKRALASLPSKEEILVWNHLGTFSSDDFVPNLACAILFAKDPRAVCPGARIRFQRFSATVREPALPTT